HRIRLTSTRQSMTILLPAFHAALLLFLAWRYRKAETGLRIFFWPAFGFKVFSAVCVGLLYTFYYHTADTFAYFDDGSKLAGLALSDFSAWCDVLLSDKIPDSLHLNFNQPRALFLVKITSVFNILTANNYWIISAYYAAISFSGAWCLVKTIQRHIPAATLPAVLAFLFFPSVVFWTSGLLKESLAVGALYYLAAIFLKVWFRERLRFADPLLAVAALWIFWNLKYYYAAVFIPVVVATLAYRFLVSRRISSATVEASIWIVLLAVPLASVMFLHPNFYPHRLFSVILANNAAYNALSDPGGVVHFHNLQPTALSLAANAPWALFSGLFRPLLAEASEPVSILASIENTAVLVLFGGAVWRIKKYGSSPHRLLILAAAVYVIALCILLTFSAPNFGTLSRYRSGYYSFFVFLLLCDNPFFRSVQRSFQGLVSH
ncbi:MAG TPA: hypothetical protein VF490_16585, partial [Chryseosolibacter sp.]